MDDTYPRPACQGGTELSQKFRGGIQLVQVPGEQQPFYEAVLREGTETVCLGHRSSCRAAGRLYDAARDSKKGGQ